MVDIPIGYYFCHVCDLGTPLELPGLKQIVRRDSLVDPPPAIQYLKVACCAVPTWVNRLGQAVVFQQLTSVDSLEAAVSLYENRFEELFNMVQRHISAAFGTDVLIDTSFLVRVGGERLEIGWRSVTIPDDDTSRRLLIEAVLIDELCRIIERSTRGMSDGTRLSEERKSVVYVENLFALSLPEAFLVSNREIQETQRYYTEWRLGERVAMIRSRFAESVTNTALFRGHLERHSQGAMNSLLTAIAIISLTQATGAISGVMRSLGLDVGQETINAGLAAMSMLFLAIGLSLHVLYPALSLRLAKLRGKRIARRICCGLL